LSEQDEAQNIAGEEARIDFSFQKCGLNSAQADHLIGLSILAEDA
jgi:hypothetical protein